jgi:hypothetical protein
LDSNVHKQSKESLKKRAAIAWKEECARRESWARELYQELADLLGINYPIELNVNEDSRPVAEIEGLRFILTKQSENGVQTFKHLILLSNCSQCGKDTRIDIDSLADLGRWLVVLEKKPDEYCSRCIGLPNKL